MDVNIAATSGKPVMLLEAEVVVFVTTTSPAYALESVAVPSLSTASRWRRGRVIIVTKISGRRAIHGVVVRSPNFGVDVKGVRGMRGSRSAIR